MRCAARYGMLSLILVGTTSVHGQLPATSPTPIVRTCRALPNSTLTTFTEVEPRLNQLIAAIVTAIRSEDHKGLRKLFHPRLQRGDLDLTEFFTRLRFVYRTPLTLNVTRLWELRTAQAVTELHCAADTLYLKPLYGYDLQYFLWLSVVGKKELGRVIVPLVNSKGKWVIGALHTRQWTHLGFDFNDWLGKAMRYQHEPMYAWALLDITRKLMRDSPFIRFPQLTALAKAQQQLVPSKQWQQKIKAIAAPHAVIFVNSIFTLGGVGILLRLHLPQALSGKDLSRTCRTLLATFQKQKWFKHFSGIKCSFVVKGEPTDREGVLGGIYMPQRPQKQ